MAPNCAHKKHTNNLSVCLFVVWNDGSVVVFWHINILGGINISHTICQVQVTTNTHTYIHLNNYIISAVVIVVCVRYKQKTNIFIQTLLLKLMHFIPPCLIVKKFKRWFVFMCTDGCLFTPLSPPPPAACSTYRVVTRQLYWWGLLVSLSACHDEDESSTDSLASKKRRSRWGEKSTPEAPLTPPAAPGGYKMCTQYCIYIHVHRHTVHRPTLICEIFTFSISSPICLLRCYAVGFSHQQNQTNNL